MCVIGFNKIIHIACAVQLNKTQGELKLVLQQNLKKFDSGIAPTRGYFEPVRLNLLGLNILIILIVFTKFCMVAVIVRPTLLTRSGVV